MTNRIFNSSRFMKLTMRGLPLAEHIGVARFAAMNFGVGVLVNLTWASVRMYRAVARVLGL